MATPSVAPPTLTAYRNTAFAPRFPTQQPPPRAQQPNQFGANENRSRSRGGRQHGGAPYHRIPKPVHTRGLSSRRDRPAARHLLLMARLCTMERILLGFASTIDAGGCAGGCGQ
ncbi:hypothetical protein M409DRAFT_60326 [Zasmidium cellare ATCC 36951]|uniref:Uncharacterized protein n=1 Tax=Zasmidium cellare ATCC 36951 TaxID=1080233 RepID=A0A6A6BZC9_ZASCE|nr:uncharacterized protein M409DRAFT_60326 [Zasmidium cellare ATCC 36951]KAF2160075.1 hypothetical protein M409DRAFT_60326 [Zasmidium cellare ATCC 36951]